VLLFASPSTRVSTPTTSISGPGLHVDSLMSLSVILRGNYIRETVPVKLHNRQLSSCKLIYAHFYYVD